MRICFVTANASRLCYGVLPAMVGAATALRDLGHDLEVVTGDDEFLAADLPQWQGIPVSALARVGPRELHYIPRLRAWLKAQRRFDVLILHGIWISMHAQALRHAADEAIPIMVAPHGMLSPWALGRSSWKKALAKRVYVDRLLQQSSCFWVNSPGEAVDVEHLGCPAPAALIPHGVDLPPVSSLSIASARTPRTLLFLGRLHPVKGIELLLEAWQSIRARSPDWRLAVVGPDELGMADRLKSRFSHSSIQFVGPLYGDAKFKLLQDSDALILPSLSEGLPVTVLEAWAYGLPVVMTEQCNLRVGFEHDAAVRVEPNPASIAEGVLRLFAMSPGERCEMGMRGRRLVESAYSRTAAGLNLEKTLRWLVSGDAPPPCVRLDELTTRAAQQRR